MKLVLMFPILIFFFEKANAQNSKWMFLSMSSDSTEYMVDTLTKDQKQLTRYDNHSNVVLIWLKTIPKQAIQDVSLAEYSILHFAIDTTNKQMEIISVVAYKDGNVIKNVTVDYPKWTDIVPDSVGDSLNDYCRALHDNKLMVDIMLNSLLHDFKSVQAKKTSN